MIITCNNCGSNDFKKNDGFYICQYCGAKYINEFDYCIQIDNIACFQDGLLEIGLITDDVINHKLIKVELFDMAWNLITDRFTITTVTNRIRCITKIDEVLFGEMHISLIFNFNEDNCLTNYTFWINPLKVPYEYELIRVSKLISGYQRKKYHKLNIHEGDIHFNNKNSIQKQTTKELYSRDESEYQQEILNAYKNIKELNEATEKNNNIIIELKKENKKQASKIKRLENKIKKIQNINEKKDL